MPAKVESEDIMSEHNDKCRVGRISCGEKVCDGCQYRIRDKSPVSEHTELPELAVGYMNQGMGHGHYAVIRKDSEKLFANVPFGDKNLATQVVRACSIFPLTLEALHSIIASKTLEESKNYARKTVSEMQENPANK